MSNFAVAGKTFINNTHLYYEFQQNSHCEVLILLAGFTADHHFWAEMRQTLAQNYSLLLIDNRGIGQSDSFEGEYSIPLLAADVVALIKQLGLKRPAIMGHSMGGMIAQQIAKNHPELLSKLILVNSSTYLAKSASLAFELTGELLRLNLPLPLIVQSIAPWLFSNEFLQKPQQMDNLIKLAKENPYPPSISTYFSQLDALKTFDSRPWLTDIETPTLVVAAKEDRISPIIAARELINGIKNHQLFIIKGGHNSPIEQPHELQQIISEFIGQ